MGILDLLGVLKFRRLTVVWSVVVGLAVGCILGAVLPTKYVSAARVQVDSRQQNSLTGLFEPRVRVGEFLGQQAAVATSRTVALEVIDDLSRDGFLVLSDFQDKWRRETGGEIVPGNDLRLWAADQMLRDLEVKANELESTIEIGFRAEDPAQAARVANAFAASYMATVLDQKQKSSARRAASFSDETKALAADVENAQSDLAAFREKSGVLPVGQQKLEAAEIDLAMVTERLAEARADNVEAQSLLAQAEALPISAMVSFPLPIDAQGGLRSQERLVLIAPVVDRLSQRYGPNYPDLVEARREKESLEHDVLRAIRDRAHAAASRVAALESKQTELKEQVAGMQETRQKYDLLENKVVASRDTYNLVTTRTMQEALQSRVDTIDVFLLARATPPARPATPPYWLIIIIGAMAGAALGASVAVFVELMEGRIRTLEAVRRLFRTPTVCLIEPSPRRLRPKFRLGVAP